MDDNDILGGGEPSADSYKPLHEKPSEEREENAAVSPVYDDFMYEPIGFEELDKIYAEKKSAAAKPKRTKSEAEKLPRPHRSFQEICFHNLPPVAIYLVFYGFAIFL